MGLRFKANLIAGLVVLICLLAPSGLLADGFITVNAADNIYAAGTQSGLAGNFVGSSSGLVPVYIDVSGENFLTFSVTGTIIVNEGSGNNVNDPDGVGAAVSTSSNTGYGSISGIEAPGAGYLVGVFIGPGGPSGPAPASLDFIGNTSFTSLSPLLDQVFFIGDGLTGDGTGATQVFYVPAGATDLYLGISDAGGYNGPPTGGYGDNIDSFDVTYTSVPESSSLSLLACGLIALGWLFPKRRALFS